MTVTHAEIVDAIVDCVILADLLITGGIAIIIMIDFLLLMFIEYR